MSVKNADWYFIFHPWLNIINHLENAFVCFMQQKTDKTLSPHFPSLEQPPLLERVIGLAFLGLSSTLAARGGDLCQLEKNPFRTWRCWYVCVCVCVCEWRRERGENDGEHLLPSHHHPTIAHMHVQTPMTAHTKFAPLNSGVKLYKTKNFPVNKIDCLH